MAAIWSRHTGRGAVRFVVLAALVAAAHGQLTCAATDNATTCAALGVLWTATGGAITWNNKGGWTAAASGTATSYCSFFGIYGSSNSLACTAGSTNPRITGMCVHPARAAACFTCSFG